MNLGLPLADSYLSLVTDVITLTNTVTALGSIWRARRRRYALAKFTRQLEESL